MAILDGQDVDATNSNAAFASKTQDNTLSGKQSLESPTSGGNIADAQQQINDNQSNITTNTTNISTNTTNISTNTTNIAQNATDIIAAENESADIRTTQGTLFGEADLGTGFSTTIGNNNDVKSALIALESAVEAIPGPLTFRGSWDANLNSPSLSSGVGTNGDVYVVSVNGSTNLDGITDWKATDWAVFDGPNSVWIKVDNTEAAVGANKFLSNLTAPTACNVDIRPTGNFTQDLGFGNKVWRAIYGAQIRIYSADDSLFYGAFNNSLFDSPTTAGALPSGDGSGRGLAMIGYDDVNNIFQSSNEVGMWSTNDTTNDAVQTGRVFVESGNKTTGTGDTGIVQRKTGDSAGGNSGDIIDETGTAGGTRGKIRKKDGSEGTVGHVWTSTDTTGGGEWAAPQMSDGGGKNYLSGFNNFNAAADVTSVTTYDDGAGAYVDGDGGAPSVITVAHTTTGSEVLEDQGSLKMTKAAADGSGEGFTLLTRAVDRDDRGRVLFGSIEIDATDANYVSNDLSLKAFDVTNAVELAVLNDDNGALPKSKGRINFKIATFTTTQTVRISVHLESDSATASTYDIFFDEPKWGPATELEVPNLTEWVTFTPTGSWVANTNYTGRWRRVGDSMQIQYQIETTGAPTSAQLTLDIPAGFTVDETKIASQTDDISSPLGVAFAHNPGVSIFSGTATWDKTNDVIELVVGQSTGSESTITQAFPHTFGAGDEVGVEITLPISGWNVGAVISTTQTSNQTAFVKGAGNGGTVLTADTTEIDWTEVTDDQGFWDGDQFTAKKDNTKVIISGSMTATATNSALINAYIDGTKADLVGQFNGAATCILSGEIVLTKGEVLSFRSDTGITLSNSTTDHVLTLQVHPDFNVFAVTGETELIEATSAFVAYPITVDQWGDLTSIELSPGEWDITGHWNTNNNGVMGAATNLEVGISSTAGNSTTGLVQGDNRSGTFLSSTASTVQFATSIPRYNVTVTTTTTYYLKALKPSSTTNLEIAYKISARRVK